MGNDSKKRYKKSFFGRKKRSFNHLENIKRMNERKNTSEKPTDNSERSNKENVKQKQNVSNDDPSIIASALIDFPENTNVITHSIDLNVNGDDCLMEFDEIKDTDSDSLHDDMDNYSDLCDETAWSVCYSEDDSDYDTNSECFFVYEDDAADADIDDDSDERSTHIDEISEEFMNNEEFKITGKRMVDLSHIFNEIRKINIHSKSGSCDFNDMRMAKPEVKRGFVSHLRLVCRKCYYIHTIKTSEHDEDQFDFNYECVLSSMLIGIGFSQLEEFTGVLGIPCITARSYRSKEQKIHADLNGAVEESTKLIAEKETEFAVQSGSIDNNGNPLVVGIVDAAWSKRSYRTNYSALSGSAVIIGLHTQKVLWQGVADKFCGVCKNISTNNREHYDHDCNINYVGPSTGMESKLIVDGFKECERKFDIRIHRVVGDGDSSVISELLKANIYQNPTLRPDKIECRHHLERNTRGNLRKLGEKGPLKPYLTPAKIEEIIKAVRCATIHWNSQDLPMETKIEKLRRDIYNAPFHIFGCHDNCDDYFCKKKGSDEPNLVTVMKENSTFNLILDAMARVRSNARSILLNENTNIAEQFNSLIVKYTGGKRINYSKRKSFAGRTKLAVLQHNTGRAYSTLCQHMKKRPNVIATKIEFKRIVKNLWHNNKKRPYQTKISAGVDKDYGSATCSKPDMDDETFAFEKEKFLERLTHQQANRIAIQESTKDQHGSLDWKQYRADLLTASNFGRVISCRSPQSYEGIVKGILYTDISKMKQIAHGTFYERNAIKKLEALYGITVQKCGLFIDSEVSFLGASPDGVVGHNAIVEVKCPYSVFEKDIDKSILDGTLNVWSRTRKPRNKTALYVPEILGINKRHKWYYQVQGQLHVTKKEFCYFVVWVGDDYPIKVEIIYRDDEFWKKNMEGKLVHFYQTALLPELVDPRMSRSMSLRRFDKLGNPIL